MEQIESLRGYDAYRNIGKIEREYGGKALLEIPFISLFYSLLNPKYQEMFNTYLELHQKTKKGSGIFRDGEMPLKNTYDILIELLAYQTLDFDFRKFFLDQSLYPSGIQEYVIVAVELYKNNPEMLEICRKAVYDNEGLSNISHGLIKGMIKSDNEEAVKMVFDLFKAARLSEGLRSSVLHYINDGSYTTYKMFLTYIKEGKMTRFTSVKQSLVNAYGFYFSGKSDEKNMEMVMDTVLDCVVDEKQKEYLKSEDNLKIYLALLTLGVEDLQKALKAQKSLKIDNKNAGAIIIFLQEAGEKIKFQVAKPILEGEFGDAAKKQLLMNKSIIKFENKDEKREFIKICLNALKEIKNGAKFSILYSGENRSVDTGTIYKNILEFINDFSGEEVHGETYKLFSKYFEGYYDGGKDILNDEVTKQAFLDGLNSQKDGVRSFSFKQIEERKLKLDLADLEKISVYLKSNRSDVRVNVSKLISKAKDDDLIKIIESLLEKSEENYKKAGFDLTLDNLDSLEKTTNFKNIQAKIKEILKDKKASQNLVEMGRKILKMEDENEAVLQVLPYTPKVYDLPKLEFDSEEVDKFLKIDLESFFDWLDHNFEIFMKHEGEEITVEYCGSNETKIVGTSFRSARKVLNGREDKNQDLPDYKKYSFWEEFLKENEFMDDKELVHYEYLLDILKNYTYTYTDYKTKINYFIKEKYLPDFTRFKNLKDEKIQLKLENGEAVLNIIKSYKATFGRDEGLKIAEFEFKVNYLGYVLELENERVKKPLGKTDVESGYYGDDNFKSYNDDVKNGLTLAEAGKKWMEFYFSKFGPSLDGLFKEKDGGYITQDYEMVYMLLRQMKDLCINDVVGSAHVYFSLYEAGILSKNELYNYAFDVNVKSRSRWSKESLSQVLLSAVSTGLEGRNHYFKKFKKYKDFYLSVINVTLEKELARTEQETVYTHILNSCRYFEGGELFVRVLQKLDDSNIARQSYYSGTGRREQFSNILSKIYPENGLDQKTFDALVKKYKIGEKTLIEGGVYNSRFLKFIEKNLKIDGFEECVYYFKAHMNEYFDEEKTALIRRYSAVETSDFQNGAMDIEWFKRVYAKMGEKNFQKVYSAAKYTTSGTSHKRAQYFADAILGRIKENEVLERLKKRNQDFILVYGLLPLPEQPEEKLKTATKRYQKLQAFLKESKQFGAQRRASENLKVGIALKNLAQNFGVDIERFKWLMEIELFKEYSKVFEKVKVSDYEVWLDLEKVNDPKIKIEKDGKILKSVPKSLVKNEYILELKNIKTEFKNQYARARVSLENAMNEEVEFSVEELEKLQTHPILKDLLQNLLFVKVNGVDVDENAEIGFLQKNSLVYAGDEKTEVVPLKKTNKLKVLHPVVLTPKSWASWQEFLMKNEIIQPFKQVFREIYVPTKDEIQNGSFTNRFAGYQVSAGKLLGVMKTRGWLANEGEGLEKVDHRRKVMVDLYAYADWFTPSEAEDPTVEKIYFYDQKTREGLAIKDISKILFSEIMRDVDLGVSVAFVGGVDPLLNHTTIEMRGRILKHNLELFGIKNVEFKEKHVVVKGKIDEYTIHLGSGVIHTKNKGMLPIFPVHTQTRGKIFLPFVDEDPKTSEIISKVLMLAEDEKNKDPGILINLR